MHRRPLRRRRCASASSAICAFGAAPLAKLSATIQVGRRCFGIRRKHRAAPERIQPQTARLCLAQASASRRRRDYPELGGAASGSVASTCPLRRRRTCVSTSSAICIAFRAAPLRKLSATIQSWVALLRDPSQASGGSGTDTAANGSPLSCTGVRFVVDGRAPAQAPRFASRSGQPLCANCPRLSRVGRRCFGIRRKHRAAPERIQPQTACLCLAQASASSSTDVRQHKLRDLHRVQGSPFAQIVRDYPELGGAASGSVASIGRLRNGYSRKRLAFVFAQASASSSTDVRQHKLRDLHRVQRAPFAQIVRDYPELGGAASGSVASIKRLRNGYSRKRLAFVLHRRPLRRRRTCASTSSAICIAFRAAPLRKLSATIQSWAALLRDPSQASSGSGTDTAANGLPLSCTGVRFVVDGRAPAQAPHKLRDLHRVQGSPFAQIVRDYPELGGAASGSVASIGRLRNGYSRKRLAFVLHRRPLRRRRTCASTSSAICIAFRAAPLRKLSETIQGWAAMLRDPSQALSGSRTDTAANGSPLSLHRRPLRRRRTCVSTSSAICIAFRAAPLRKLSATIQSWAALLRDPSQASSGSRTDTAANGLPLSLHRRPRRRRRTCASTSSAICIAFRAAPLRKLSATIQSWAALLRDPSQASGGSGTDTAANGSPLSCTGVRFVVDERAPAQAPRFASRSG